MATPRAVRSGRAARRASPPADRGAGRAPRRRAGRPRPACSRRNAASGVEVVRRGDGQAGRAGPPRSRRAAADAPPPAGRAAAPTCRRRGTRLSRSRSLGRPCTTWPPQNSMTPRQWVTTAYGVFAPGVLSRRPDVLVAELAQDRGQPVEGVVDEVQVVGGVDHDEAPSGGAASVRPRCGARRTAPPGSARAVSRAERPSSAPRAPRRLRPPWAPPRAATRSSAAP